MEQGQVFTHDSELRIEIGAIDIQINQKEKKKRVKEEKTLDSFKNKFT